MAKKEWADEVIDKIERIQRGAIGHIEQKLPFAEEAGIQKAKDYSEILKNVTIAADTFIKMPRPRDAYGMPIKKGNPEE